jgi:CPA1 family monovalent cation:H+ antiporter
MLDVVAVCLTLTALLAYLNLRVLRLPPTVGIMAMALFTSVLVLALRATNLGNDLHAHVVELLRSINFTAVLMQGMLSVLLFAGALHIDLHRLRSYRLSVSLLAGLGTLTSTLLIGALMWWALPLAGVELPLMWCFAFGALISPTDPIAVIGILKAVRAPASLETVIAGESLFNDGVGVVLFTLFASIVAGSDSPSFAGAGALLLREAGGGIAFGAVLGYVAFFMLRSIDSYQEETMITLATVIGGYALANHLHISGPLAMVVAGLVVGNQGRAHAMSDTTREHVDMFWELLDSIFNAVLFMLIGLEVLVMPLSPALGVGGLIAVAVVLLARYLTVGLPVALFRHRANLPHGSWQVLTWGGLRGGISVALALALPAAPQRELIVTLTYIVVVFAIIVQGASMAALSKRWIRAET